jgi:mannose-6-phosphate isomerase-like protein (cupin superfamily)
VAGEGERKRMARLVPAKTDRFRGKREVFGSRVIDLKVSAQDTNGGLSVTEIIDVEKGGPARHLHHEQEEWFYVLQGEYVIEVGEERYELGPGDCALAPRKVAHTWAYVGEAGQQSGSRGTRQSIQFAWDGANGAALVDRITDLPRTSQNSVMAKFSIAPPR